MTQDRIMTGYTVHTGTSKKFTEGWDNIFDKKTPGKKKAARKVSGTKAKSRSTKKKKSKSKS